MRRRRIWMRPLAGATLLGVLLWRLGSGPVLAALSRVDSRSLAVATALAAVTTVCSAWRWVLVARGLGVELSLRSAVAFCYRSQFLNVALPGGVLGDVQRGVLHGRNVGDLARGLRSVVWERSAGQAVQVVLVGAVITVLPSPLRPPVPLAILAVVLVALAALVVVAMARLAPRRQPPVVARAVRTTIADVRAGVLGRRVWPGVVGLSVVVVADHVATFLVAAHSAGSAAPLERLVPLALVVLVAMGLPLNVAGWGPREGAAAWTFGAAGLGVEQGLSVAVTYGVLVLVASLPGAVLLLAARTRRKAAADA